MLWGEWLANSPMLVFLVIALAGKNDLSKVDYAFITSFFMCIVFGFLPIIPQPKFLGYLWVVLSAIACIPVLLLPWYVSSPRYSDLSEQSTDMEEGKSRLRGRGASKSQQQFHSALWLTIVNPLFPLTYILAATKVIEPGHSVGVFLLLTLVMKAVFAASLADIHVHAFLDALRQLELEMDRQANMYELEKERYANECRRNFLKYLFHEVRTPLNSLTMGIELLWTRDKLDTTDKEVVDMMKGAAEFMGETLNNVLNMQRIEEGKMELVFVPFSIRNSINKVFAALSGPAIIKNLSVVEHIAADVPALLVGDVYRVEHVISNLLSNAIKFSPIAGSVRVEVVAKAIPSSSGSLSITVSITDEGPGIPLEDQGKLFTGFFQARPDQLQQGKGSGLGLALCNQIVTLHGGSIGVDSMQGQGSTFHFSIPFGIPSIINNNSNNNNNNNNNNKPIEESEEHKRDEKKAEQSHAASPTSLIRASKISGKYEASSVGSDNPEFPFRVLVVDGRLT